jgi:hypothetical protein
MNYRVDTNVRDCKRYYNIISEPDERVVLITQNPKIAKKYMGDENGRRKETTKS